MNAKLMIVSLGGSPDCDYRPDLRRDYDAIRSQPLP
jgi:hypothetical protein